ncbi:MAG: hypothetical protein AAFN93_23575, partial [Bacteroidota bacterium]
VSVSVVINFSYEQAFKRDIEIDSEDWTVLLSTHYETGKLIDLTENLQAFEVSILQKIRKD